MWKQFKKSVKENATLSFHEKEKKKCEIDWQKGELFSASPQLSKNQHGRASLLLLSNQLPSSSATQHVAICICSMDPSSHPKIQQVHTAVQRDQEEVQELSENLSSAVRGLQFSPERNLLRQTCGLPCLPSKSNFTLSCAQAQHNWPDFAESGLLKLFFHNYRFAWRKKKKKNVVLSPKYEWPLLEVQRPFSSASKKLLPGFL